MCLEMITGKPKKTEGWGWQVVRRVNAEECESLFTEQDKPRGKWLKARRDNSDRTGEIQDYQPGFHLFETRLNARYECRMIGCYYGFQARRVVRVQYRGAHTRGFGGQGGCPVIVASQIRIPTVEEWRLAD